MSNGDGVLSNRLQSFCYYVSVAAAGLRGGVKW